MMAINMNKPKRASVLDKIILMQLMFPTCLKRKECYKEKNLTAGTVSSIWKNAYVIPKHGCGSRSLSWDYWAISHASIFTLSAAMKTRNAEFLVELYKCCVLPLLDYCQLYFPRTKNIKLVESIQKASLWFKTISFELMYLNIFTQGHWQEKKLA